MMKFYKYDLIKLNDYLLYKTEGLKYIVTNCNYLTLIKQRDDYFHVTFFYY